LPCWFSRSGIVFDPWPRQRSFVVSLAASYSTAVLVNTVRITIAMWLASHPATLWTFSAAEIHRIEGIAVYFVGLALLQRARARARSLSRRVPAQPRRRCPAFQGGAVRAGLSALGTSIVRALLRMTLPLAAYYGITLAIPFANGAFRSGAVLERSLTVLIVPPTIICVGCVLHLIARAFVHSTE
jgi:hypothetical protein